MSGYGDFPARRTLGLSRRVVRVAFGVGSGAVRALPGGFVGGYCSRFWFFAGGGGSRVLPGASCVGGCRGVLWAGAMLRLFSLSFLVDISLPQRVLWS